MEAKDFYFLILCWGDGYHTRRCGYAIRFACWRQSFEWWWAVLLHAVIWGIIGSCSFFWTNEGKRNSGVKVLSISFISWYTCWWYRCLDLAACKSNHSVHYYFVVNVWSLQESSGSQVASIRSWFRRVLKIFVGQCGTVLRNMELSRISRLKIRSIGSCLTLV